MPNKSKPIKDWPVMARACRTCVFSQDSGGEFCYPDLARMVEGRLLQVSQICHHPRLSGHKETHLCRGTRDRQIEIFYRMGFLEEPTDACWQAKRAELGL